MGGTIMSVKVCQRFLYSLPTLELKVKSVLVKEFLISTKVGLRKLEHLQQKEIFSCDPYFRTISPHRRSEQFWKQNTKFWHSTYLNLGAASSLLWGSSASRMDMTFNFSSTDRIRNPET